MKAFIRQLRDRHVVKVGIAYLVVAWVVLQLADVVLPALNLPEWTITLTLALLAAGFPVTLVLAWVFDITPTGIERTDAPAGDTNAAPAQQPSIAVLPFSDLSAEQDQEHFCDGMTEELLNVLTRIPHLRVASRTSCFAFKGRDRDLASVQNKLRVAHVLEGSVRKSGSQVRVSVQLIEVASDSHLWAETYDRELCDIFAIQSDIATRILQALQVRFGMSNLPDPTTRDPKAYEYFLRGRGYAISRGDRDIARAIELFRKAVDRDPKFVRAWIELAEACALSAIFLGGGDASCEGACEAAAEAMRLAPERGASYLARGLGQLAAKRYDQAVPDFLRALELDPTQVSAWHWLARAAHHQGQTEKEREYFRRATELNPDDYESPLLAIATHEKLGDTEGALRMARIGLERVECHLEDYPNNPRAYYLALAALTLLGKHDRAVKWAEKALALAPDDRPTRYNLACFFAREGQIERALECLEGSIQSRSWIENDPDMDRLRELPRYRSIIEALPD